MKFKYLSDQTSFLNHLNERFENMKAMKIIKEVLRANDYLDSLFEPIIKKRLHQIFNSTPKTVEENRKNVLIPYIYSMSDYIQFASKDWGDS